MEPHSTDKYSMFLSQEELVELTGYKTASKQREHLKSQRIAFHTNKCGQPKVARTIIEGVRRSVPKPEATWSPSWAKDA
uniref:DUF4224 domain-containing protein n=1 Tax=Rhodoferax sp. GW822-FHT02A01 TaxID=3141537 RepID=UPI00406C5EBD